MIKIRRTNNVIEYKSKKLYSSHINNDENQENSERFLAKYIFFFFL